MRYDLAVPPTRAGQTRPKRLTLDLDPHLHRALKIRAVGLDLPMAELLRALIEQALNEPAMLSKVARDLQKGGAQRGEQ